MYTVTEWPSVVSESLKPFFNRRNEISVEKGILLWGYRIIVPEKFRLELLTEIHATHMCASKMKMLSRQYFWWPKLDSEIEDFVKSCDICLSESENPNKAKLIKYEECKYPLERIHIDF